MTGDMHIHQEGKGERQPAQHPPTHQQTNTHTTNEPFCGLYVRSDVLCFYIFLKSCRGIEPP
jgi:hypothetical protein